MGEDFGGIGGLLYFVTLSVFDFSTLRVDFA